MPSNMEGAPALDLEALRRTIGTKGMIDYISKFDSQRAAWEWSLAKENGKLKETKTTEQELRIENGQLKEELQVAQIALEERRKSDQHWEEQATVYQRDLRKLQEEVATNEFALVLLDGDGYLFPDNLIRQGKAGGERAAQQLLNAAKGYLEQYEGAGRWSIVVRIVLNVKGLADAYCSQRIIRHTYELREFTAGFAHKEPLLDTVDVGRGKEEADHKLRENLRLFIKDTHCKHILIGCCNDRGYLTVLSPYKDNDLTPRISLIEHCAMVREYRDLPFKLAAFKDVFRDSQLPPNSDTRPQNIKRSRTPSSDVDFGVSFRGATAPAEAGPAYRNGLTRTRERSTLADFYILQLNRAGQRLDYPIHEFRTPDHRSFAERKRRRLAQFCAPYHIFGCCQVGKCQLVHGEVTLSLAELLALAIRTRDFLCREGPRCRNTDCVFGHHCATRGTCEQGWKCRFLDSHGMDMAPAPLSHATDTAPVPVSEHDSKRMRSSYDY